MVSYSGGKSNKRLIHYKFQVEDLVKTSSSFPLQDLSSESHHDQQMFVGNLSTWRFVVISNSY